MGIQPRMTRTLGFLVAFVVLATAIALPVQDGTLHANGFSRMERYAKVRTPLVCDYQCKATCCASPWPAPGPCVAACGCEMPCSSEHSIASTMEDPSQPSSLTTSDNSCDIGTGIQCAAGVVKCLQQCNSGAAACAQCLGGDFKTCCPCIVKAGGPAGLCGNSSSGSSSATSPSPPTEDPPSPPSGNKCGPLPCPDGQFCCKGKQLSSCCTAGMNCDKSLGICELKIGQ